MVGDFELENLVVHFPAEGGFVKAVDNVTVKFAKGTYTAIVGESGCGKSVLGQGILGILPENIHKSGQLKYLEYNLLEQLPEGYHGRIIGIVPQNPSESMNPIRCIKKQMLDVVGNDSRAMEHIEASLKSFGLDDTQRVLASYPFELSGGMQQRVLCAMSMLKKPEWILSDEPTKGLDETTAEVVYENLQHIKEEYDCGMVIITHDIQLAKKLCDKIAVMYAGQILEFGSNVLDNPMHPYTKAFVASLPENGFEPMEGKAPAPGDDLQGCKFAPRCKFSAEKCFKECPKESFVGDTMVRCFLYAKM